MAIQPASGTAPAAVLAAAGSQVKVLEDRMPTGFTNTELIEGVEQVQVLKAHLAAVETVLIAEADARDLAKKELHWGTTADWVTHVGGLHRCEGRRIVANAKQLVSEQTATLASMRRGETSPAQAAVICAAIDTLPSSQSVRAKGEAFLIQESQRLTATELAKAARHLANVVDPDREDRKLEGELDREERAAHRDRFLSVTEDGMGGVRIKGRGSVEDGEVLRTAWLPLTKPNPAVDPEDPTCETERDPRDHGARTWDAVVHLAQHALDVHLPPESHGARPRIGVTMALEDLTTGLGEPCPTETGLELDPATVRRLACDADLIPAVLGTDGQVLDVGRAARLVTWVLWIALILRDNHCAFPGCTRPPSMCHGHHIIHWANGGITALFNLVMLCGEHHRVIHHTPWEVRLNPDDGRPEFLPPPRRGHDPPSEWIRHRKRRE